MFRAVASIFYHEQIRLGNFSRSTSGSESRQEFEPNHKMN